MPFERKLKKMFKSFKTNKSPFEKHDSTDNCNTKELKDYFENHFKLPENLKMPDEIKEIPQYFKHLKEIPVESVK